MPTHFGQVTAGYVRPIVLEYVGRTRRSMPNVRRNVNGSGPVSGRVAPGHDTAMAAVTSFWF